MAEWSELPLSTRLFLRVYPWRRIDPVPWSPITKPLADCRVALVTSAGLFAAGDAPFDPAVRGGDPSWRAIPDDVELAALAGSHRSESFDPSGIVADRNLALPLDRLRELASAGRIGSVAKHHASFMGSLTAVGRFVRDTAPAIARHLKTDGVDVALLVPL